MNVPARSASLEHEIPQTTEAPSALPSPPPEILAAAPRTELSGPELEAKMADELRRIEELTNQVRQAQGNEVEPPNLAETLEERATKLNQQAQAQRTEFAPADKGPRVSPLSGALLEAEERRTAHLSPLPVSERDSGSGGAKKSNLTLVGSGEENDRSRIVNLQDKAKQLEAQFESAGNQKAA